MKNHVLRILIAAVLVTAMLVACGKQPSDGGKTTPSSGVTVSPTTTPDVTPTEEIKPTEDPNQPTPTDEVKPTDEATPTPTQAAGKIKIGVDKLTAAQLPAVDGALALEPFYDAIFAELMGLPVEDAKMFLPCNNTPQAYANLTSGKVDMIFCALPSDEQVQAAKDAGVEFEYHTVLSGGFVFFVSRENPVDSVTLEQLKGIVSGKITNWKEVGGDDEPIVLFQRNEGSGSQTGLYRYVLPKDQVKEPILEHRVDAMAGAIDRVADYDNGKGAMSFSYYYYVANMHGSEKIKLLGIDGVIPSDETIAKGQYPFLNFSQIVTRSDLPEDSIVRDIIKWVQGPDGARIARENGYVPYEVE